MTNPVMGIIGLGKIGEQDGRAALKIEKVETGRALS